MTTTEATAPDVALPETENTYPERTLMGYLTVLARGFIMGSADVVPGVSGGTMAFILGIYEELIDSIKTVASREFIQAALKFQIKRLFEIANWKFLLAVALGILLAIFSLAQALEWLLINQPVLLWSFFFGLIVASVFLVGQRIEEWNPGVIIALIAGAVGTYFLVGLIPAQTPSTWWFFMLTGSLVISAMLLPGVSGAFIMVLLGKYQEILAAVNDRDIVTLLFVAAGAGIGIVTFAQILSWLFKRFRNVTVAVLTGLMIGSLRKVWPWKVVEEFIIDRHGEELPILERNVLPALTVDGAFNMEIVFGAALAIVAMVLILVLERVANQGGKGEVKHGSEAAEVPAK